jgi:N,N'-diacetyllegionaminate synthase
MRKSKVFIIAEAGVNHNGSLGVAKRLVDAAVTAGAGAVKFQTFVAERLVSRYAPKARYQKLNTRKNESQLSMIKRLELSTDDHKKLIDYCRGKRTVFLSSPFDLESVDLLAGLGLKVFKIPSGEITNLPYLRKVGALRKKIIMSTGMATLAEINAAMDVLLESGTKKSDISVLHCNTEYPTPFSDVNLYAMLTMKEMLGVRVGYSDHTAGIEVAIAAAALGASIIEKHITLDNHMKGPDHRASLEPDEFTRMVKAVRNIEAALGDGIKKPSGSETKNIMIARKSIVASGYIDKGERFTRYNLTVKRPGNGLSPMLWDAVLKRRADRVFHKDDAIKL